MLKSALQFNEAAIPKYINKIKRPGVAIAFFCDRGYTTNSHGSFKDYGRMADSHTVGQGQFKKTTPDSRKGHGAWGRDQGGANG